MMDRTGFSKLEAYMHSCMSDSAHDKEHVYRVLANAMVIAKQEQSVDYDVLICACLLHDIGRADQLADPSVCHAQVGAQKAFVYLLDNDYGEDFAQLVADAIRTHRFRKNAPPETLEAKILFDADKLDVVGAIGIARTLAYQGTVGAPLYTRTADGKISDGNGDETPSFFQEYHYKLTKLYDRFYTQAGAQLARERKESAERFYEDLRYQLSSLDQQGGEYLSSLLKG